MPPGAPPRVAPRAAGWGAGAASPRGSRRASAASGRRVPTGRPASPRRSVPEPAAGRSEARPARSASRPVSAGEAAARRAESPQREPVSPCGRGAAPDGRPLPGRRGGPASPDRRRKGRATPVTGFPPAPGASAATLPGADTRPAGRERLAAPRPGASPERWRAVQRGSPASRSHAGRPAGPGWEPPRRRARPVACPQGANAGRPTRTGRRRCAAHPGTAPAAAGRSLHQTHSCAPEAYPHRGPPGPTWRPDRQRRGLAGGNGGESGAGM